MDQIHNVESLKKKIIIKIYEHPEEWINTSDLASALNLRLSATRNIVRSLRTNLKDFATSINDLQIVVSKNKGLKLVNANTETIQNVCEKLYAQTIEYEMLNYFLHERINSYTQYCMDNYISMASLRRKIKNINDCFEEYGLKIWKNRVHGEELSIRSWFAQYYWEIHKAGSWPFQTIDKNNVMQILFSIEKKLGITLREIDREKFCYAWAVSKIRRDKQHFIERTSVECSDFSEKNKYFYLFKNIVCEHFPNNKYQTNELQYAFYLFFCFHFNYASISTEKLTEIWDVIEQQKCNAANISKQIIYELNSELNTEDFQVDKTILYIELYSTCQYSYLFQKNVSKNSLAEYTNNLEDKYPILFRKIQSIVKASLKKSRVNFNENLIMEYLSLIIHSYKYLSRFGEKVKIAITSSLGDLNEKILENLIKHKFLQDYNLEFVSTSSSHDIIVTDFNLIDKNVKNVVFLNHHNLSPTDFINLENYIKKVVVEKLVLKKFYEA